MKSYNMNYNKYLKNFFVDPKKRFLGEGIVNLLNIFTYPLLVLSTGILLKHSYFASFRTLSLNFALKEGSSKQGNACLACTA